MLPKFSQNVTLQEAFETAAHKNKELKITESIDFLNFFAKRRKSVEKMIHQKKNRGHRMSNIVKSRQSYSNGHLSYHCSFYYLARASMHDVACKFASAVSMRRNN